ncbi:MAG: class I SAM-dependent methyltransferase [Candidatus Lindowbacteria bacterium]|nr:class I SAM-dependent methyltransferase [Candidatus Lindowbacteria bacterium]
MEQEVYKQFYDIEKSHWWFQGMRTICRQMIVQSTDIESKTNAHCLDIGCGTGLWTRELDSLGSVTGMDLSVDALEFCKERGLSRILRASAGEIPLKNESVDLVCALGLIEHLDDDAVFLKELLKVCRPGGHVLILTSAYKFLWCEHDDAVHHKRRYTRRGLKLLIEDCGFHVTRISYVNMSLLAPIVLFRGVRRALQIFAGPKVMSAEKGTPDFFSIPSALNRLLYLVLAIEGKLMSVVDLPFGVGLIAVITKKETKES